MVLSLERHCLHVTFIDTLTIDLPASIMYLIEPIILTDFKVLVSKKHSHITSYKKKYINNYMSILRLRLMQNLCET